MLQPFFVDFPPFCRKNSHYFLSNLYITISVKILTKERGYGTL